MMPNVLIIAKRELDSYFISPIAYVVGAAFLFVTGLIFYLLVMLTQHASVDGVHFWMIWLLLLTSPVITMRLLAEEQRSGTIELLLTLPVRDWEVVIGKYLAALCYQILLILPTFYYLFILKWLGTPDIAASLVGYLAIILIGGAMSAIGLFASSLTQSQIIAAIVGLVISLTLWFAGAIGKAMTGLVGDVFSYLSLPDHYFDMSKGVIDTTHIIYFLSIIAVFLFITVRTVEARRWR